MVSALGLHRVRPFSRPFRRWFGRRSRSRPTRRRSRCRQASIRSSARNWRPMGWCSLWPGNLDRRSWARSTSASATPMSRTAAGQLCAGRPPRSVGPSVWGRLIASSIDNRYRAFADPLARQRQSDGHPVPGVDILRGSLIAGHSDRAGLYPAPMATPMSTSRGSSPTRRRPPTSSPTPDRRIWTPGRGAPTGPMLVPPAGISTRCCRGPAMPARSAPPSPGSTPTAGASSPPWRAVRRSLLPQLGPGVRDRAAGADPVAGGQFRAAQRRAGRCAPAGDTSGAMGRVGLQGRWTIVDRRAAKSGSPTSETNLWRDWGRAGEHHVWRGHRGNIDARNAHCNLAAA